VNGPIMTLEPLIEAVRDGMEGAGWELSGLQKTTSHQFEGRWEGESTRSAYLFFHAPDGPEWASIDVYLDETGRGLTGNLALVVDLAPLGSLGSPEALLEQLAQLSGLHLPAELRRPLTIRFRMPDADARPAEAESEVRFKARIPRSALKDGEESVRDFARRAVTAFEALMASPEVTERASSDLD
jgi:hypothetical protein